MKKIILLQMCKTFESLNAMIDSHQDPELCMKGDADHSQKTARNMHTIHHRITEN